MRTQHLTDKNITNLAFATNSGARYEINDATVSSLYIRVGTKTKTFFMMARFGKERNASRRTIGNYPIMKIADARRIAGEWTELVAAGTDPGVAAEQRRELEIQRRRSTFASAMEDYIAYLPTRERNRATIQEVEFIRRNILNRDRNPWMHEPIWAVTDKDVSELVEAIRARGATAQAYRCLKLLRTFFSWTMLPSRREALFLDRNPIQHLSPRLMKLGKKSRSRHFEFLETQAFLRTAALFPYPYGPFSRSLIETGQRDGEIAKMRWSNVDLDRRLWTIPGGTSKPEDDHHVPLSDAMVQLLRTVRSGQREGWGDFVFSASHGQRPICNISRHKTAFQKMFVDVFQEIAPGRNLRDWRWHDVRRTVRTHLEPIVSRSEVAEAAIGHGKMGIERVYNLYKYRREIREAFNVWSNTLQSMDEGTLTFEDWEH